MKVLLDTTPLYGVLTPGDQHEVRAKEAFSSLPADADVRVPVQVLLELHALIVHRKPRDPSYAYRAVRAIADAYPVRFPADTDVQAAMALLQRYPDQAITLADALTASMAAREGAGVFTFDARHFTLMGAALFPSSSP